MITQANQKSILPGDYNDFLMINKQTLMQCLAQPNQNKFIDVFLLEFHTAGYNLVIVLKFTLHLKLMIKSREPCPILLILYIC